MKKKNTLTRREQLINIICSIEKLDTDEAAKMFDVSKETIRQDFLFLENKGIIEKVYGGAVLKNNNSVETILIREEENLWAKDKIAKRALQYIAEEECVIGLDTGSTVALLSSYLSRRKNLFIVSNSYRVMQSLANTDNRILLLGGEYTKSEMAYYSNETSSVLKDITLDIYFLGTSGVMNRGGIYAKGFRESYSKQGIMARSNKNIVLADSSKFQKNSLVEVAPWTSIDILITDNAIPSSIRSELEKVIEVVIAE